jgi:hypothetical protein
MGPNALRVSEGIVAILNGFTLDETTDLAESESPMDDQAANAARDYVAALPDEQFPNLVAVSRHFGQTDDDQSFDLLIDLFVDGLAQRVHALPASEPRAGR